MHHGGASRNTKEDELYKFTVREIEDVDAFVRRNMSNKGYVRQVVSCIHTPNLLATYESSVPIGLQLPKNASLCGDRNFSSLQGGIKKGESVVSALIREAKEEYSIGPEGIRGIEYLTSTLVPVDPRSRKATKYRAQWLHWFAFSTVRLFKPNSEKVADFGWFGGPDNVFDALSETRSEKVMAFAAAVDSAIKKKCLPPEYGPLSDLLGDASIQVA